jgi:hypothetical protein
MINNTNTQFEVEFLLVLKEKMKQLQMALKKERADKVKLSNMLKKEKFDTDISREPRLSMSK